MPQVCVDRNLKTSGGDATLGLQRWSAPRPVAEMSATSTGDGAISSSGLTSQPGRLMVDATVSWTSDSPLSSRVRLQVIRPYRTLISSNPNALQIWEAWNSRIGSTLPVVPTVPNSYAAVNSLCTLAFDAGTNSSALPYRGYCYQDYPHSMVEDWYEVPAGDTLAIHYRAYVWTPPPWSNNASANAPIHEAYARGVKLRLWAFPTQDEAVR